MNKKLLVVVLAISLLICFIFVWPTLYRYDTILEKGNRMLLKTNRLTGKSAYFSYGAWRVESVKLAERDLPYVEASKIQGNAKFGKNMLGEFYFTAKIYNGSSWTLTELVIRIKSQNVNGTIRWDRVFRVSADIPALSSGEISVYNLADVVTAEPVWGLEKARGYK